MVWTHRQRGDPLNCEPLCWAHGLGPRTNRAKRRAWRASSCIDCGIWILRIRALLQVGERKLDASGERLESARSTRDVDTEVRQYRATSCRWTASFYQHAGEVPCERPSFTMQQASRTADSASSCTKLCVQQTGQADAQATDVADLTERLDALSSQ